MFSTVTVVPSPPGRETGWQARAEIDLGAIRHNTATVLAAAGTEVMAVVKGDGYGHGALSVARAALAGGATWLGTASLAEAMRLRAAGITAPVLAWLVPPYVPRDSAVVAGIHLSASSTEELDALRGAALRTGVPALVHLKADTGLGRGGARPEQWPALVGAAARSAADGLVRVVGVWSHLVHVDDPGHPEHRRQIGRFTRALDTAAAAGLRDVCRHLANSAAALDLPAARFDMVRAGSALYGLTPRAGPGTVLRPSMALRARVAATKRLGAGCGVGYGHTYVTDRPATVALIPLGYAHGVPRAAGNRCHVWLGGARRPIIGRVSMDQLVVECGDDPVAVGDVATLLGPGVHGEPTAHDWAAALGTVSYEVVTNLGGDRIDRTYLDPPPTAGGARHTDPALRTP
ncbi:alanine racemase [Actinoplanes cyaneus]|uniref:Alanine racemase n=1 Tax=Actinoplanes cyaneus TaxID=52696 RepID=A0A919IQY9_9ACTN|nr:alanine racemase [Actinoplanes cyaneus]MCW2139689.1 alanine racemase [Actinoplanes cyaneus]GID69843.1 alanine racemase [Actinoplanes cyaneus]